MKKLSLFLSALLAGMSVGFGGLVFLSAENRVIGAALFTVGTGGSDEGHQQAAG